MRITKEQKQENRNRILETASVKFRERGFDGVSVAEIMEEAGLTHGGFYNHFRSKEELMAAATAKGFSDVAETYAGYSAVDAIRVYLSRQHRDALGHGCTAAALCCEAARLPRDMKSVFAEGIEGMIHLVEGDLVDQPNATARAQAIGVLAQAVGALMLSRACPDDSALADEILSASWAACEPALTSL